MSAIVYYLGIVAAAYVAVTLVLFMLSARVPAAAFFARLLVSYVALLICASLGVVISIVLRVVVGNAQIAQWATGRCFKYVMWYTTGTIFTIEDPNNWLNTTRPAVFIGNHQTELDVLMLGTIFPKYCSVTAKKSLKSVPFLGWFMSLSGSVFIDRHNTSDARAAMQGAADEIQRDKQSVYMFPEGTRSYSKEPMLLPFKKGAFHLAVQAGVPIVPVVAANYSDVLYVKDWKFNAGKIPVKVLKPIQTTGLKPSDVDDLARDTRELMLREIVALTAKARGRPVAMPAQKAGDGVIKASGAEATITKS